MNPLRKTAQTITVAGHRGHRAGCPENTLASFKKARELGGEGVVCETDVMLSADGELILIHDETLDRTTNGFGLVREKTYAELAQLDAGNWFGAQFAGERIPLLKDAIILAQELGFFYQVELKTYHQNDELFSKLRALVDALHCADVIRFSSFDLTQVKAIKKIIPEVPTIGHSFTRLIDPVAVAKSADLDALSLEIALFPRGEAQELHEAGIAALLYVPDPTVTGKLSSYGVDYEEMAVQWVREGLLDQIISDDVAMMARVRRKALGY